MPNQLSSTKWAEVVILAESSREPFEDIRVTTAQTEYVDAANYIASGMLNFGVTDINDLGPVVMHVIDKQEHSVREHVIVDKNGIKVCVNVPAIGEEAMVIALDMVAEALDRLNGHCGTVYFSEDLKFTTKDITWLYT